MSVITWDATGERKFEAGVKHGVYYPYDSSSKKYTPGVAWNGLTKISESPDGADAQDLWADNMKYGTLRGAENHKGTIEAYFYPDEFMESDGTKEVISGVYVGQQKRKTFGMSYVTCYGDDTDPDFSSEKIHLVYGMSVSPASKDYETINENPDATDFSWDYETTPVDLTDLGLKPSAIVTIDCAKVDATKLKALKEKLYGTDSAEPELPDIATVISMLTTSA